jgi:hypothetical protein
MPSSALKEVAAHMSIPNRRESSYEDARPALAPDAADPSVEVVSPTGGPEQAKFQADINGTAQPTVNKPTRTVFGATAPGTAAAVRWIPSSPAPFPIGQGQARPLREAISRGKLLGYVPQVEQRIIDLAARSFEPAARIAIFVIYFWFGFLKVINLSSATPLATALTSHTIGMQYFNVSFKALAFYECGLGLLFLIPAMTRLSVILLVVHMGIVISPLIIVANVAWTHPLVPTLEGQYIIKNLAIIALAVGILAHRYRGVMAPQTRLASPGALGPLVTAG